MSHPLPTKSDDHVCTQPCQKAGQPKEVIVGTTGKAHDIYVQRPKVALKELLAELHALPEAEFTSDNIADFLHRHPVQLDTIQPYLFWEEGRYTRNLIERTPRYEVMLLCWEKGRATPIHNHSGQSCWVYLLSGKLSFVNYKWLGCDRKDRTMHLEEMSRVPMAAEGSLNVIDEKDAIHRLGNDATFDSKAISLHIYSKPLSSCAVYDAQMGVCEDRPLSYYSIEGKRS